MKNLSLLISLALIASCGAHSERRGGGLNSGKQTAAVTLLTGSNNDLVIPGGSPTALIRLTPAAGGSTLSGLTSSYFSDGDMFWLRNESATDTITITNADTASAVANRFLTPGAVSLVLQPKGIVLVEDDGTSGLVLSYTTISTFSGGVTFTGAVTTTSGSITSGVETITSGAASLTKRSLLSVTGPAAFTLADGTVTGQIKTFECTVAATTPAGTLTITTPAGSESATHVFTAVGQKLTLQWTGAAWHVTGKERAGRQAVVVGTTVLTGYDMSSAYDLAVTATVHSTSTKGIPNGSVAGEHIHIDVLTAASSATGDIDITAKTTVGIAATNWGSTGTSLGSAGSATTAVLDAYWDGAAWQVTVVSISTLAMNDNVRIDSTLAIDNVAEDRRYRFVA